MGSAERKTLTSRGVRSGRVDIILNVAIAVYGSCGCLIMVVVARCRW